MNNEEWVIVRNYELFDHKDKKIFLINMTKEKDYIFSDIVASALKKNIKANKKIWIIVNKKWYSGWIYCQNCGFVAKCDKCDISIAYHKVNEEKIGLCHICKTQYNYPQKCPQCNSEKIQEFGIWTQQIQEILESDFKIKTDIIESNSVKSIKKINTIWEEKDIQVYIGTSVLNTAIKWVNLDLIVFLNADLWLNIPYFSAPKNNFHFLYDTFKSHSTKNYIVQTFNPEHYSIRYACKLDKNSFEKEDSIFRKKNKYPPFTDICIIMSKDEVEERLFNKVDKLYQELLYLKEKYELNNLEIYSTPSLIYKTFNKYRYNIILKWENLRNFIDIIYTKLKINQRWFKIDWDPNDVV